MIVLIELESNAILMVRIQNHTSGKIVKAYQILNGRLKESGILPTLYILLNNECSGEYKEAIPIMT